MLLIHSHEHPEFLWALGYLSMEGIYRYQRHNHRPHSHQGQCNPCRCVVSYENRLLLRWEHSTEEIEWEINKWVQERKTHSHCCRIKKVYRLSLDGISIRDHGESISITHEWYGYIVKNILIFYAKFFPDLFDLACQSLFVFVFSLSVCECHPCVVGEEIIQPGDWKGMYLLFFNIHQYPALHRIPHTEIFGRDLIMWNIQ